MQTNPKEVLLRYGKNTEFMKNFQDLCKLMGTHFSDLPATNQKDTQDNKINKIIQEDSEVKVFLNENFCFRNHYF